MIIGNLKYDAARESYTADIVSLNCKLYDVAFVPVARRNDKEPDFRVIAPCERGHVELGAGWKRTTDSGKAFVSVSLDGPLLATPINAALFLSQAGDTASLVWSRPKARSAAVKDDAPSPNTYPEFA